MAKLIGYHDSHFSFDDGRSTDGMTLYFTSPIGKNGDGFMSERQFVSFDKLGQYVPRLGDEIIIDRNAKGSVKGVILLAGAK